HGRCARLAPHHRTRSALRRRVVRELRRPTSLRPLRLLEMWRVRLPGWQNRRPRVHPETNPRMSAVIRHLFIYPVKSTRAIAKTQVRLAATGFEWDRHWMAASSNGVFMSQRTQPRLARIETEIGADVLTLRAP